MNLTCEAWWIRKPVQNNFERGQEFSVLVFVWHLEVTNWFRIFDQCLEPSVQHEFKRGQADYLWTVCRQRKSYFGMFFETNSEFGSQTKTLHVLFLRIMSHFVLERGETLFGVWQKKSWVGHLVFDVAGNLWFKRLKRLKRISEIWLTWQAKVKHLGQLHSEVVSITLSLFLSRCVFVVFQLCIPGEAMADRIVAGDDEHSKLRELQELLHRAQEVEQSLQ